MTTTRKLYRMAYRLDQANRAARNPARFAKNRVKSKALGGLGFYRAMSKFWRA